MKAWLPSFLRRSPAPTDPVDVAFVALGASAIWTANETPRYRFDGGYVEFIDAAVTFAPLVSVAATQHSDAPFVWAYHVAAPFGRWMGGALLDAGRPGAVSRAEAALALEGIIQHAYEWNVK